MKTIYNHQTKEEFQNKIKKALEHAQWQWDLISESMETIEAWDGKTLNKRLATKLGKVLNEKRPKLSVSFNRSYSWYEIRFFEWIDGKCEELRLNLQYFSEGDTFDHRKHVEKNSGLFKNMREYPKQLERAIGDSDKLFQEYLDHVEKNNALCERFSGLGVSHILGE